MWPASVSKDTLQRIVQRSAAKIRECYPPAPPPGVAEKAPDLVNKQPLGDLTVTHKGELVASFISPLDVASRGGCPSPGIWAFFWPLQILSAFALALSAAGFIAIISKLPSFIHAAVDMDPLPWVAIAGLIVGGIFFHRFLAGWAVKWGSIAIAAYAIAPIWGLLLLDLWGHALVIDAVLLVPAVLTFALILLVVSERELSDGAIAWFKASALGVVVAPVFYLGKFQMNAFKSGMLKFCLVTSLTLVIAPVLFPIAVILLSLAGMFLHRVYVTSYLEARKKLLQDTARDTRTSGVRDDAKIASKVINAQHEAILREKLPRFPCAIATGVTRKAGDSLSWDAGTIIRIGVKDTFRNVFVWGKQGSGKTDSWMVPQIYHACEQDNLGVAIFDGKSSLMLRMANSLTRVIDPQRVRLNIIEWIEPAPAAKTIHETAAKNKQGQDGGIFDLEAESYIRRGLYVIRTLSQSGISIHYSLTSLKNFLSDEPMRLVLLRQFFGGGIGDLVPNEGYRIHISARDQMDAMPEFLRDAFKYFLVVYPTTAAETRSGVVFTANAWLDQLVGNAVMNAWAGHESDFNVIEEFVHGAKIGIAADVKVCGSGGAVGVALLKESIYQRILLRGQNPHYMEQGETPVEIFIDEASQILTSSDQDALSMLREFQCGVTMAAQNIMQVRDRLGEQAAAALLNLFASHVLFSSSEETEKFVVEEQAPKRHRVIVDKREIDVMPMLDSVSALNASNDGSHGGLGSLLDGVTDNFSKIKKQFSTSSQDASETNARKSLTQKGVLEVAPTLSLEEVQQHLLVPFHAYIVLVNSGGKRTDICTFECDQSHPMYQLPDHEALEALKLTGHEYVAKPSLSVEERIAEHAKEHNVEIAEALVQALIDLQPTFDFSEVTAAAA